MGSVIATGGSPELHQTAIYTCSSCVLAILDIGDFVETVFAFKELLSGVY